MRRTPRTIWRAKPLSQQCPRTRACTPRGILASSSKCSLNDAQMRAAQQVDRPGLKNYRAVLTLSCEGSAFRPRLAARNPETSCQLRLGDPRESDSRRGRPARRQPPKATAGVTGTLRWSLSAIGMAYERQNWSACGGTKWISKRPPCTSGDVER